MRLFIAALACLISVSVFGQCSDPLACNFGEDEPCEYVNEDGKMCAQGGCEFEEQQVSCQSDLNGNGSVGSEDLLLFFADYDTLCE